MIIDCIEYLDEELEEALGEGFGRYADANGIVCNFVPFAFVAKENGEPVGFLTGRALYKEAHVSDLIVLEQHRGKGVGKALLRAAEDRFRNEGYENINLSTYGFQAPGFYEKCGFTLEFSREDLQNPKLTKYYYVKYLRDEG